MSPLKRVGIVIIGLAAGVLVLGFIAMHVQRRRMTNALVADAEVLLARTTTRPTATPTPKHQNGFACLADFLQKRPSFGTFAHFYVEDRLATGDPVPDELRAELAASQPWITAMRECGNSAFLRPVPGARPFELASAYTQALLALGRATAVEGRALAAEGRWEPLAEVCASTLEFMLDQSRLNLLGALSAETVLRQVMPSCLDALWHLDPAPRAKLSSRFAKLHERMGSNREIMETERIEAAVFAYSRLLSDAQLDRLPPLTEVLLVSSRNPFLPPQLQRLWRVTDPVMRQLAEHADAPGPMRTAVLEELADVETRWWVPDEARVPQVYGPFLSRFDDARLLLGVLSRTAAGESDYPPSMARTPKGYVFTTGEGKKIDLPLTPTAAPAGTPPSGTPESR